jgi:hypothetical protein
MNGFDAPVAGVERAAKFEDFPVQPDLSGIGDYGAGQTLDECRLTRSVVADYCEYFLWPQSDVRACESRNLSVPLDETDGLEDIARTLIVLAR